MQQRPIQVRNVTAGLASDFRISTAKFTNDQVSGEGGAIGFLMGKENARVFELGELVYVHDIKVGKKDVTVDVISVNMYAVQKDGKTEQKRYRTILKFEFQEGELEQGGLLLAKSTIEKVLATEEQASASRTIPSVPTSLRHFAP